MSLAQSWIWILNVSWGSTLLALFRDVNGSVLVCIHSGPKIVTVNEKMELEPKTLTKNGTGTGTSSI